MVLEYLIRGIKAFIKRQEGIQLFCVCMFKNTMSYKKKTEKHIKKPCAFTIIPYKIFER